MVQRRLPLAITHPMQGNIKTGLGCPLFYRSTSPGQVREGEPIQESTDLCGVDLAL